LDYIRDSGATLVITVDNGIVAIEQAKYAKEIGLDLIITDHHLPLEGGTLPEALTIVHSTEMCGAAVAWCLIQSEISKSLREELLQFVAIATVGDMIPLTGLGRAFVVEGLRVLNKTKNPGLLALLREAKVELGKISSFEIGHAIGPRLNAIGRLEHAIDAVRLLCTDNEKRARELARLLEETNNKRKDFTILAVDQALLSIKETGEKKVHIVYSENFLPGVIGLIAARICQDTLRPSIAISVGESVSKGSARSVDGVNIAEVIRECSDILVDVGGHKGAAGFSILKEHIPQFVERMEKLMEELPDEIEQVIEIEAEIEKKKLTKLLVRELDKFAPFGHHNSQPLLCAKGFMISDIRTLSEGKHLKFKADKIDCIGFGMGEWSQVLRDGQLVDLAFFTEINTFRNVENLQLRIKDIRIS
jgi:single-stranded-DNA-specific exonuclease